MPWNLRGHDDYEAQIRKCEIDVVVTSKEDRAKLLGRAGLDEARQGNPRQRHIQGCDTWGHQAAAWRSARAQRVADGCGELVQDALAPPLEILEDQIR